MTIINAITSSDEDSVRPNRTARRAAGERSARRPLRVRRLVATGVLAATSFGLALPAAAASYPYPNAPDCTEAAGSNAGCVVDQWNFYQGQCTSGVAWKLNAVNGVAFTNYYKGVRWGNAANWDDAARSVGIPVNGTPARGAVAQWNARNHVAWVEKVNSDGSIVIWEMNYDLHNGVRTVTLRPGTSSFPDNFIHIKDLPSATAPASSYVGKIVRNQSNGAAALVKADGRKYWVPSGGDWTAMVNNGIKVVNVSNTQYNAIPNGNGHAVVKRVDEPAISGPSRWMTRRTGTTAGYGNDYWLTTSAGGKSYTTNAATWTIGSQPRGVYRVKAYIPTREAVATVTYNIYNGSTLVKQTTVNQRNIYGWVSLGDVNITSGTIKVVQADNWSPASSYNQYIGWDVIEAIPIR